MKTQLSIQECMKDLRVEKRLLLEQLSQQTKILASTRSSYESDDYKEMPYRNMRIHSVTIITPTFYCNTQQ